MPATLTHPSVHRSPGSDPQKQILSASRFTGDPATEIERPPRECPAHGVLVPLVVAARSHRTWEVVSGHRRLACAGAWAWRGSLRGPRSARPAAPAARGSRIQPPAPQDVQPADARGRRARNAPAAEARRTAPGQPPAVPGPTRAERRNSDARGGRTDATIARAIGFGGKDLYRQARADLADAQAGDPRA